MAGIDSRPRDIEKQVVGQLNRSIPHCDMEETNTDGKILITTPLHYQSIKAEFIRFIDDGTLSSGIKRATLTSLAKGKYICFIDDDDFLADDYVDQLLAGCTSNADVVTFNLQFVKEGIPKEVWKFGLHPNHRREGLMCVNHLCAWKREIATKVNWDPLLGNSDDRLWFEPLFHSGAVQTQFHIDKSLYFYDYHANVTLNQKQKRIEFTKNYIGRGLRCFKDKHGEILVEANPRFILDYLGTNIDRSGVLVRDSSNQYFIKDLKELTLYHSVKL